MPLKYVLFELASGYTLFEITENKPSEAAQELEKFSKLAKLISFIPFKSAAEALSNINDVSEGIVSPVLKEFLSQNVKKGRIGVLEKTLAGALKEEGFKVESNENVAEWQRLIRLHLPKLLKQFSSSDIITKSQLGLGHAYSRAKLKFNVNKSDTMVTQAICLLDKMDKDLNTFSMRVREWYSWHFPELAKLVSDNLEYAKLALLIKQKEELKEEDLEKIDEVSNGKGKIIFEAAKSSMGTELSELDMINVNSFCQRVVKLAEYRKHLYEYLQNKMNIVAPNTAALVGDVVGARLISHAGSLLNLSKYPASTIQILGAEKALFRALKARNKNTPKYGIIYNTSFISSSNSAFKGKVSRLLANKLSIVSRIDSFGSGVGGNEFGLEYKKQLESKIDDLKAGGTGNSISNQEVVEKIVGAKKEEKKRKREDDGEVEKDKKKKKEEKKEKKDKKDKKKKSSTKE